MTHGRRCATVAVFTSRGKVHPHECDRAGRANNRKREPEGSRFKRDAASAAPGPANR